MTIFKKAVARAVEITYPNGDIGQIQDAPTTVYESGLVHIHKEGEYEITSHINRVDVIWMAIDEKDGPGAKLVPFRGGKLDG